MTENNLEEYEIEPWFTPSPSPGAPIPAPKYVPFTNYKGLTQGNYFSHTVHPDIALAFNKGDVSVQKTPQSVIDDIYNRGLNVRMGASNKIRPAAWNYNVPEEYLGSPKELIKKLGQPLGRGDATMRSKGMGRPNPEYVKAKYAARPTGHNPPNSPRLKGTGGPTFIYKGPPKMFDSPTKYYTPNPGPPPKIEGEVKSPDRTTNPYAGKGTGKITKKPIGYFPAGSDKFMTKPGSVTGRMPMFRGIGGGLIGMFMEGPELQEAKTDPYYGNPEAQHAWKYGI